MDRSLDHGAVQGVLAPASVSCFGRIEAHHVVLGHVSQVKRWRQGSASADRIHASIVSYPKWHSVDVELLLTEDLLLSQALAGVLDVELGITALAAGYLLLLWRGVCKLLWLYVDEVLNRGTSFALDGHRFSVGGGRSGVVAGAPLSLEALLFSVGEGGTFHIK